MEGGAEIETVGLTVVTTATLFREIGDMAQLTYAVTRSEPEELPAKVWMEVPVVVPLQPDGSVHEYDVAPGTGLILYVSSDPEHTVSLPVIGPGLARAAITVTGNVFAVLCPQPLTARTVIVPVPLAAAVVEIVLVVLVPAQPEGSVQV